MKKYVCIEDLVAFALNEDNKWLYPEHPEDLAPFIDHAVKAGGVRMIYDAPLGKPSSYYSSRAWYHVEFPTREAAEKTLDDLRKTIRNRDLATVTDYFMYAGHPDLISSDSSHYGWTDLSRVCIYSYISHINSKKVWGLKLPEPLFIEYR